jgi:hypothetical protein
MWLTGKASANNVNWFKVGDGSDIGVSPHVGPVLCEHGPTPRIDFDLPPHIEARSSQPQVEAADAGEE